MDASLSSMFLPLPSSLSKSNEKKMSLGEDKKGETGLVMGLGLDKSVEGVIHLLYAFERKPVTNQK